MNTEEWTQACVEEADGGLGLLLKYVKDLTLFKFGRVDLINKKSQN